MKAFVRIPLPEGSEVILPKSSIVKVDQDKNRRAVVHYGRNATITSCLNLEQMEACLNE